jgi:hypothetical protein
MTQLPLRRDLQPLGKSAVRRVKATDATWFRLGTMIISPNLGMVVGFCAIGLLVTANVVLRFPDFAAIVEQLGQFP